MATRKIRQEELLSRLEEVTTGEDIDYELIGRMVVGTLLGRRNSAPVKDGMRQIRGAVQFGLRLPQPEAGRTAEICCLCWRGEGDLWECIGKCCPDERHFDPDDW